MVVMVCMIMNWVLVEGGVILNVGIWFQGMRGISFSGIGVLSKENVLNCSFCLFDAAVASSFVF